MLEKLTSFLLGILVLCLVCGVIYGIGWGVAAAIGGVVRLVY